MIFWRYCLSFINSFELILSVLSVQFSTLIYTFTVYGMRMFHTIIHVVNFLCKLLLPPNWKHKTIRVDFFYIRWSWRRISIFLIRIPVRSYFSVFLITISFLSFSFFLFSFLGKSVLNFYNLLFEWDYENEFLTLET